mmetsp:Transcript_3694/g.5567  ORF Transcript_3694/g.5567 Transcript_3694/m.5567 type:complete len:170 (-) Transcript_3694:162-671(-)|eukprot:CAMPEP_0170487376 /NCGR_PEP_ID=MMETSP0208-20121228/6205_1 /TAXON_ID=197538 /ORGANISM="Strombidium inclinatum, Strain S3" /LENGTH=169 /DNA_ID=CAMNT_0010761637 /DNA_START=782 /DNA_END=1291 /DNA_ORIENTATION=-
MKGLQDEKGQFEEYHRESHLALIEQYEQVVKRAHEKESYSQQIVREHLELKHVFELEERAKNEENEALRQENQNLRNTIRKVAGETSKTVETAKQQYEEDAEEFSSKFRGQIRSHNENMSVIRDQYHKLSGVYKKKMEIYNEQFGKEQLKMDQKDGKRKLELEGFQSDL